MNMMRPDLEEEEYAAQGYKICPVVHKTLPDFITPVEAMRALMNMSKHCFILESTDASKRFGKFTFLGYDPNLSLACTDGHMKTGDIPIETDNPGRYIRQILDEHKSPKIPSLPTSIGGLVGHFSYDYLKYSEPSLKLDAKDEKASATSISCSSTRSSFSTITRRSSSLSGALSSQRTSTPTTTVSE